MPSSEEEHLVETELKEDTVVSWYLLADEQPEEFADLADLQIVIDGDKRTTFLCFSSLLARESKVLCTMFSTTPKEGWADGVTSMFNRHQKKTVELVLAMVHSSSFSGCLSLDELEDLLRLVHKLDAPKLMNAVEKYAASLKEMTTATMDTTLYFISLASTFDLKRLKFVCMDAALSVILTSKNPAEIFRPKNGLAGGWQAMHLEDILHLLTAVTKALKDWQADFKPEDEAYRRKLLDM